MINLIFTSLAAISLWLLLAPQTASPDSIPARGMIIKHMEQDGQHHVKLRAAAFEQDGSIKFPIKTLDSNSFKVEMNDRVAQNSKISLTTYDHTRRKNSRATILIYDATSVKSFTGLTRQLRTLIAQEFPSFQSEYLSVLGVAAGKTIERISLTPTQQENILALQRSLIADLSEVKPSEFITDSALCIAARKFELWAKQGLRDFDQKTIVLMGGASVIDNNTRIKTENCIQTLKKQNINIHQISFSKNERSKTRLWITDPEIIAGESIYHVVDLAGASRAIQNIKTALDYEYVLTIQIPIQTEKISQTLTLVAKYHDSTFKSQPVPLPETFTKSDSLGMKTEKQKEAPIPQKLIRLSNQSAFVLDAWLEWLAISLIIGFFVTLRHANRMHTGITEIFDRDDASDVNHGPLLIILNGKNKGKKYCIRQSSTLLGRGWTCDIRLQPLGIKRKHARLEIQGDKAILQDLSEGELIVNGRTIRSIRVIGHGSVIRMGELHLLFQCGES